MKNDTYRSQFRLPRSLYEQLKDSAEQSNRSLNAELVERLERSFDEQPGAVNGVTLEEIHALLKSLESKVSNQY